MAQVEIVNNERDRKGLTVPVLGADGKQERDVKGKLRERVVMLGSTLDATSADPEVAKPRIRMDEKEWDVIARGKVVQGWIQAGNISVFNVRA